MSTMALAMFLRKVRIFNKLRYARNRQLARVIFYFALYINIIIIFGVHYFVYNLTIYHSWMWWGVFICFSLFFLSFFFRTTFINK